MSVFGLDSGYTVKYDLSPRDFPRAQVIFYLTHPNTDTFLGKYWKILESRISPFYGRISREFFTTCVLKLWRNFCLH